jgi:tetratricopeptide (TPR) repeat protein
VEQALANTNDSTSLGQFDREHDNLRAALEWSLEREETGDVTVRLVGALTRFWMESGYHSEGQRWIERVVPLCTAPHFSKAQPRACAQVFTAAGYLARWHADFAAARLYGERGVDLWRMCHDTLGLSFALGVLGRAAWQQEDPAREHAVAEERVELSRELEASEERISALEQMGRMEMRRGNSQTARSLFEEALELAQVSRGARNLIQIRGALAALACSQNDMVAAREHHEAALAQARVTFDPVHDTMSLHRALVTAGWRAGRLGDHEQGMALFEENLSLARSEPDTPESRSQIAWGHNHLGDGLRCQGDHVQAAALYEESLALFRQQRDRQGIAAALHNLGHVALVQGETPRARASSAESLFLFGELKLAWSIADCVAGLAGVSAHEGDLEQAALLFGAAEAAHQALDASGWLAEPANTLDCEREIAIARGRIDAETWEKAWSAGRAMSIDQALAFADRANG